MAISNRIRNLRIEDVDLSQAQLAKQVEISRQTLNAIERAYRVPSLEIAHRIADPLDCCLDDVFHYESEFPEMDEVDEGVTVIVRMDGDPEWWKRDDVCRVTTRA